jgi:hypothetical protein
MRKKILWGAVVALLAVLALPSIGFGRESGGLTTSHGLTPSDIYTTQMPDVCHESELGTERTAVLPTQVNVAATSNLTVYFASMWSGFERDSTLVRKVEITGDDFFDLSPDFGVSPGQVHNSGTMMWTFQNVAPGTYTVQATLAIYPEHGAFIVHNPGSAVQSCELTVIVAPAA